MPKTTVAKFIASLPADRREGIAAIRKTITENADPLIAEVMQGNMIAYVVPHSVYPNGYHCNPETPLPFLSLASQKNNLAVYLFCNYIMPEEDAKFRAAWKKSGKRLDMGKSCLKIKKIEDAALDVLGKTIKRMTVKKFVKSYEANVPAAGKKKAPKKKSTKATKKKVPTKKKVTKKKRAKKKTVAKKASSKTRKKK